jgi:hypothetical protein
MDFAILLQWNHREALDIMMGPPMVMLDILPEDSLGSAGILSKFDL